MSEQSKMQAKIEKLEGQLAAERQRTKYLENIIEEAAQDLEEAEDDGIIVRLPGWLRSKAARPK